MPKRKKPVRRKPATRPVAPLSRLRETWLATRRALIATEQEFERQVRALQTRLGREGQAFGRTVRESVQSALAALNIPTRDEIARLTRQVEALSRRLDARKR